MDDGDTYPLTDGEGCPVDNIIFPEWRNLNNSVVYTNFMSFKWPDTSNVRFQCDCQLCYDKCEPAICGDGRESFGRKRRFAVFQASMDGSQSTETLPVFSTVIAVNDSPEDESSSMFNEDGDRETALLDSRSFTNADHMYYSTGSKVVETYPLVPNGDSSARSGEVCVPSTAFGLTIGLAAFLSLAIFTIGSYGLIRKKGSPKLFRSLSDRSIDGSSGFVGLTKANFGNLIHGTGLCRLGSYASTRSHVTATSSDTDPGKRASYSPSMTSAQTMLSSSALTLDQSPSGNKHCEWVSESDAPKIVQS